MSSTKDRWVYVFIAGQVVMLAAYGISSWLMADPAGERVAADMSLAYGVLLWIGAPIAFVAVLPLLAGIVKVFTKS